MPGANLGTAYVQIVPTAKGISGSVSKLMAPEAKAAGIETGTTINKFAAKALLAGAVGAALIKVIKGALDEGGKLQQSYFGGLDTLYGDAAESMREHARAAAAYGVSMNNYAEQAVSFGAALKSAYGGDVLKAAQAADMAIQDMADNSAKMGTSIESIQNAYQGFAKQNYTMLDNLKLGYGGTKKEMERLLEDASKLKEANGKTFDINKLGDVYEAIHLIQGELQLTGVAAGEAEGTFTGSFASMQAAAKNFLGSLAIGEDVKESLRVMLVSASTFIFRNLVPMVGNVLKALPGAIVSFVATGIPLITSGISKLVEDIVSSLGSKAQSMSGDQIAKWVTTSLPKIIAAGAKVIGQFAASLVINIPMIVAALGKIGGIIIQGLGSALWGKVKAAAAGIRDRFLEPINNLKDKVKAIIDKIKGFFSFKISTPKIPLPHFSISPSGWKLKDLLQGTIPSLSIRWFAEGGILNGPTLFGAGEAGPEAILPLSRLESMLEDMNSGVTINNYITVNNADNPEEFADRLIRKMKLDMRTI